MENSVGMEGMHQILRCQRIGCNEKFSIDCNPEGSCTYHDAPIFHDGIKEWSCCKKRSHDFSLFLEIPGCKVGKHTTEKPLKNIPVATTLAKALPTVGILKSQSGIKGDCSRCKLGFFCSDHAPKVGQQQHTEREKVMVGCSSYATTKKVVVDINHPEICRNKGCGQTFREKDNSQSSCNYHPGPAIFHDRVKWWKCCDVQVKEFDEFLSVPPCTKGWHSATDHLP